ncbi:DJ-1/PfpI family protein [Yokenella regensburgei]|uniref:DJ-1/PfpI family protein n=1 Tax=Yokenella regensburgei TaxID=158877 RepID=UPI003ED9135D
MKYGDHHQVCEAPVPDGISHMGSGGSKPDNIRRHDIHYSRPIAQCKDGEKRLQISFLIFDGVTALDFIGPAMALSRSMFDVQFVAKDEQPVYDDNGLGLLPTATFADIQHTDILCVPGTANPYVQLKKTGMIDWVSRVGESATWVTSVCTGSLILGAAGLLKGYKATSHWAMIDDLAYFGATPTHERVVQDRNRITGGGITSGIDFGLTLLGLLKGASVACSTQLSLEYDPLPPFNTGSPRTAPVDLVVKEKENFHEWLKVVAPDRLMLLEASARKLGLTIPQRGKI